MEPFSSLLELLTFPAKQRTRAVIVVVVAAFFSRGGGERGVFVCARLFFERCNTYKRKVVIITYIIIAFCASNLRALIVSRIGVGEIIIVDAGRWGEGRPLLAETTSSQK